MATRASFRISLGKPIPERKAKERRSGKSEVNSVERLRPSHPESVDPTNQLVTNMSVML
jgi:hypothetical protein